jgi:RimJ/RimL family protein N-acetyltransferase
MGGIGDFDGSALRVPVLETERLRIRPFSLDDLDDVHRLLDAEVQFGGVLSRQQRADWLHWTVLCYEQLASLYQPPYGDRALVRQDTGALIGACGYVPLIDFFSQIPGFDTLEPLQTGLTTPQVGLYYAIAPSERGQGFATEAARALIDYGFKRLRLARIVAGTSDDNLGSIGVMKRLGMRVARNAYPDPPWLQVLGFLDNPSIAERFI